MSASRALAISASLAALAAGASAQVLQSSTTNVLAIDDVEITPDQRYAVVRENWNGRFVRIYDLSTGLLAARPALASSDVLGEVLDAVAVTNTRAVVLGGQTCAILDLTNIANPLIVEQQVGFRPNDVAITPDGTIAVVRGGNTNAQATGGSFLFRLADGAQIGFAPGLAPHYDYDGTVPYSFDTDGVAVTDRHAVTLSLVSFAGPPQTRVTIWDLHPSGGGAPAVILETGIAGRSDLTGAPHDVAITPDGQHAVVRSEEALAVWTLAGGAATRIFAGALTNDPGPFSDTAMDSVEVTDDFVVTLANVAGPTPQTQVEVVDWSGSMWSGRIPGRPHDLSITPDGTRAVVRTGAGVALYRVANLGSSPSLVPLDWAAVPSATDGYLSGLDSVAVSDDFAVTLANTANLADTRVSFWGIARDHLAPLASRTIANTRPTDVLITSDMRRAIVTGNATISVFHLGTGGRSFEHRPVGANAYYQWCDGAAASLDRAVGIGQNAPQSGWITLVDTSPISTRYCTANPNSSGRRASILALGKASVSTNSLDLCVDGAPANARGRFVQGQQQTQVPFGDGVQCVGGNVFGLRFLQANVAGSAFLPVNFQAQVPAGIVLPGSTWNYQFVFLDPASQAFGINSSDALSITFGP